jgi:hypothetical protein
MKLLSLLLIPFLLVGCSDEYDAEQKAATKASMESPENIGVLPNGKTLKRIKIDRGDKHDHFVYFVDETVTINYAVPQGKTTANQVTVLIDGIEYSATPKNVEK